MEQSRMKCLVVNCSKDQYNLGSLKLKNWLESCGNDVVYWNGDPGMFSQGYDLICLSVIFSWDAKIAKDIALRTQKHSIIWCGGPGMFALRKWWKKETGLDCTCGVDHRFEKQKGDYKMTFASRGCPVGCWFCIVPQIEGKDFILYWDFEPAPILCDNNLSELPVDFQQYIVEKYKKTGIKLMDANSGFEPRAFTDEIFHIWRSVLKGPWRFAFDEMAERDDVERMMKILQQDSRKKRVYVLIGNEPIQQCYERAQLIIEWGGEPYCQPVLPLNAMSRDQFIIRYDWTKYKLKDFTRWANRFLWRKTPLSEYKPRKLDPALFSSLV